MSGFPARLFRFCKYSMDSDGVYVESCQADLISFHSAPVIPVLQETQIKIVVPFLKYKYEDFSYFICSR
jgi:hypothetical protein